MHQLHKRPQSTTFQQKNNVYPFHSRAAERACRTTGACCKWLRRSASAHRTRSDDGQRAASRLRREAAAGVVAVDGDDGAGPEPIVVRQYQRDLLGRMMSFLGPATLIPLGDPLMSLVDTICIGQFAGTQQLAALGPANLVFSFAQYMFQSLQVASLSLLAGYMRDGRLRRSEETLSSAVAMAALFGVVTTLVLEAAPEAIIRATGLRDPALLPLSAEYVRLRGLAQPAVLVTMVAQSGLLAQQDSATPALTVAASVLVSLLGSVVFVAGLGWGLAGAAVTTVACQYVGAAALLYALSVRGKLRVRLRPPRREVVWQLLRTMAPLSVTYLCKNVSYLFIQTTAASLATAKLAAHQALFAVWNLLAWTVTPFEQAALTYLPGTRGWRKAAGIALLVGLGAAGGVACGAALGLLVATAPGLLTRDAGVWPHMRDVAALASASMLALGADVVASGVNIGMGDSRYVAQSYLVTLSVLGAFMAASRAMGWELTGVWWGVVVFFGVRAVQSTGRVFWRHLRPGGGGGAAAAAREEAELAEAEAEAAARAAALSSCEAEPSEGAAAVAEAEVEASAVSRSAAAGVGLEEPHQEHGEPAVPSGRVGASGADGVTSGVFVTVSAASGDSTAGGGNGDGDGDGTAAATGLRSAGAVATRSSGGSDGPCAG